MRWSNLSSREQKLIVIGLVLLLAFGYYRYVYQPYTKKLDKVSQQLEQEVENLRLKSKILARKREIEQKYKLLKQKLEEKEDNFLSLEEDSKLVVDLNNLASQTGVELLFTLPRKRITEDIYVQYPVSVGLEGNYNEIINSTDKITELDYLARIKNLHISSKLNSNKVQAKIKVISYALDKKSGDQ
ncbi:type 4a pilus biogenesis protein PilO [Sporohalobacter salinus]|uniref:type 4a pilus biogenesis protein PilO n=1 Tax=Sporohalobacter salinus TaxID=1494606 RepID=UPI001961FACC|nr:type 4a pilus biogenesis protein PilO [Sporohalobacter salinus]MBM7622740.1 type IV pilus assembly protein PilO [Sporohalobacter salinus]